MLKGNLKRIFTALLFFQGLLIVSGGAVRLTGSGLGCPTWPTCTGNSYKPVPHQAQGQLHAWIEFDLNSGKVTYASTPFFIASFGVEFASGMEYDKSTGDVCIYLGVEDRLPMTHITNLQHLRC